MCGIAGIMTLNADVPCAPENLSAMISAMRHRGPDEQGIYIDDHIGLAHARLSIIDLSRGSQPLCNEDKTVWLVYNGEIYNYVELRAELESKGHRFATTTDSEVIVHAYEEKGMAAIEEFNGQFAFGLWDSKKRALFLARDRVGVRPLHYCQHGGKLYFASEVKSIFSAAPSMPREIDPRSLDQVFTLWAPIPGSTMFKGVAELEAGHYLSIGTDGAVTDHCWWRLPFAPGSEWETASPSAICEKTATLIDDAVRIRLRADVPVATYLSGGLDSSIVTTLAARHYRGGIHSFGIRFDNGRFDEGEYQKLASAHAQTRHHEAWASAKSIGDAFRDAVWHCEKSLMRTAPVPLFLLSKVVRESGIKVVLTGEGADEFWGGYDIFKEARIRRFWANEPQSSVRPRLFSQLYPDIFRDTRLKKSLPMFFGKNLEVKDDPLFSHKLRWDNSSRAKQFFSDDMPDLVGEYATIREIRKRLPSSFARLDPLSKAQYLEAAFFLTPYLLSSQGDRVAMAHSVEIRLPFMDTRVMHFAGSIPAHWRLFGLDEKYALKRAFRRALPSAIAERRKHPYRAPIQEALLPANADHPNRQALHPDAIRQAGLFNPEKTGRLIQKIETTGSVNEVEGMALSGILSTMFLWSMFVDRFEFPDKIPLDSLTVFIDRRTSQ